MRMITFGLVVAFGALGLPSGTASAQQPLRINIGFVAGSAPDTLARLLTERMRDTLGRPVIIDNRPGAAGRIAVEATRAAAPDGNTLMMVPNGPMTLFPWIFKGLGFEPARDFTPVSLVAESAIVLSVSNSLPVRSVAELRDWARANPAQASFGSGGTGTILHFTGLAFSQAIGVPLQHIPYKGAVLGVKELLGGNLPMVVSATVDMVELHRAGKIRALAITSANRTPALPDVPTLKEAGLDVDVSAWFALYGPAKLPADTLQSILRAVSAAVSDPKASESMQRLGLVPVGSTPEALAQRQARETRVWEQVARVSGFKPQD